MAYFGIYNHWKSQQAQNFRGQDALEQKALARDGKRITTKKVTPKLEQGLNVTVDVDFWFCNDDACKKPESKKCDFFRFSMTLKTVILVIV